MQAQTREEGCTLNKCIAILFHSKNNNNNNRERNHYYSVMPKQSVFSIGIVLFHVDNLKVSGFYNLSFAYFAFVRVLKTLPLAG